MSTPSGYDPYAGGATPYGNGPYGINPYQPTTSATTDVVSILGLVFALLCCTAPVGLVLGLVGLRRTANHRRSGRPMAWLAVVLGGLFTVLGVLLVILLLRAPDDFWDDLADGLEATPDPWSEVEVGTCFDDPSAEAVLRDEPAAASTITIVDCDSRHQLEVFRIIEVGTGDYPGQVTIDRHGASGCTRHFENYVGTPYAASGLEFIYYYPTKTDWADGDRRIVCAVIEADAAKVAGSLRDANR